MANGATEAVEVTKTARALRKVVYTCTFDSYDNLLSPLARTPGTPFLHFSDRPAPLTFGWRFRPLPEAVAGWPQNEANRYCKLLPHRVLPDVDLSIYIDGNILVLDDLTPLIEEFVASDADLALFPGENNRTVEEEILLVLKGDRLSPERAVAAKAQLAEYRRQGCAHLPITMNGILFRRHGRSRIDRLMEGWWEETMAWAVRDQFSLPPLLDASDVTVHRWNWQFHFTKNPYFQSFPHRGPKRGRWGALSDAQAASLLRAPYRRSDRVFQRYVVWPLRRAMGRPPLKETFLRPATKPLSKGD